MNRLLCIHGHFYQPPREDPWLGLILPEGSAAPSMNWNERISRESYGPMGWARRLDGSGKISDIINCYEWISFNFGPTLLSWLESRFPAIHARLQEGDRKSLARCGHGNALAQVYHHVIMPLASDLDRHLEVAWGIDDFKARFGREPEGMWLAEAAVDTPSLEVLAERAVRFVILAPRQAKAVAPLDGAFAPVNEASLDISRPYRIDLPSGRHIAAFFYNGPISQAVAFERLLRDGEAFWQRIARGLSDGLLSLATDGETYGHHFPFGEMALAYVLEQGASGRDGCSLTNFGAALEILPPTRRVALHEPSSWSCVHGVERWRSDCGCTTGGHPSWNQRWRSPLRRAMDRLKEALDAHYFSAGAKLFNDPTKALVEYGRVLARIESPDEFGERHLKPRLPRAGKGAAFKLLAMEQWALAAFASCAWFFDDLARIEPMNSMTYALRAMELAERTGGKDIEAEFADILAQAESNQPGKGSGRDIWERDVKPRRETTDSLAAQALLTLQAEDRLPGPGGSARVEWPGASVEARVATSTETELAGGMTILWSLETAPDVCAWRWDNGGWGPLAARFGTGPSEAAALPNYDLSLLAWNKRQALAALAARAARTRLDKEAEDEALRLIPHFQEYDSYQTTQTGAPDWGRLWPALVMVWVRGLSPDGKAGEDLLRFLREMGATHPDREDACRRIVSEIDELLSKTTPPWPEIEARLERAYALGFSPDLWVLQNRLWSMRPLPPQGRRTAALLWFAEGAL